VDPAELGQFFDVREAPLTQRRKANSTTAFDFTFAVVTLLAIIGIWLDVWSHLTYGADQSIFGQYHLLFYTATVMAGWLLAYVGITNLRAVYRWTDCLPVGYGLSLAGVVFFGVIGCIDLTSHAIWGFETGLEALNSPSHIGLFRASSCSRGARSAPRSLVNVVAKLSRSSGWHRS